MGVPAIRGYSFHPWMAGFYQWNASDMRSEVLQITYGVIYGGS